jgi:hypothetical protein
MKKTSTLCVLGLMLSISLTVQANQKKQVDPTVHELSQKYIEAFCQGKNLEILNSFTADAQIVIVGEYQTIYYKKSTLQNFWNELGPIEQNSACKTRIHSKMNDEYEVSIVMNYPECSIINTLCIKKDPADGVFKIFKLVKSFS